MILSNLGDLKLSTAFKLFFSTSQLKIPYLSTFCVLVLKHSFNLHSFPMRHSYYFCYANVDTQAQRYRALGRGGAKIRN